MVSDAGGLSDLLQRLNIQQFLLLYPAVIYFLLVQRVSEKILIFVSDGAILYSRSFDFAYPVLIKLYHALLVHA